MNEMRRGATPGCRCIALVLAWMTVLWGSHCTGSAALSAPEAVPITDRLQLFLDDRLIESMHDLELKLHSPRPAEIVLRKDKPWEDDVMYDPVVIKDGPRYRMWYRTNFQAAPFYTGYAESNAAIPNKALTAHVNRPIIALQNVGLLLGARCAFLRPRRTGTAASDRE